MMSFGAEARRQEPLPAGLWVATLAAAATAGGLVAWRPAVLIGAVVLTVGLAGVAFLFAQPRWVLLGSVFALVAHAVAVLRAQAGLPLTLRSVVLLLVLGLATRYVMGLEHADLPYRELGLLAALGGTLLLSSVFAADSPRALERVFDLADSALLALLLVTLLDRADWLRRGLWAYVLAAGGLAALAVLQQLTGTYTSSYGGFANVALDGSLVRSTGPIDANYLGQLLVAAAALSLYLALAATRRPARLLAAALGAICVVGVAFTFSRGSLLTAMVVLTVVLVLRRVRPWVPLAALVAIGLAALLFMPPQARDRIAALAQPASTGVATGDPSVRGRFSENLAALQMYVDHPYLGVGPDNYPERYLEYSQAIGLDSRREERHPHNLYLEALAEYGTIGALAFFAVLGFAARGAWLARRRLNGEGSLLAEGAFAALLVFLVNGVFLQASYPHYLWITIGLALVAGRLGRTSVEARA